LGRAHPGRFEAWWEAHKDSSILAKDLDQSIIKLIDDKAGSDINGNFRCNRQTVAWWLARHTNTRISGEIPIAKVRWHKLPRDGGDGPELLISERERRHKISSRPRLDTGKREMHVNVPRKQCPADAPEHGCYSRSVAPEIAGKSWAYERPKKTSHPAQSEQRSAVA
jgi:hypothetical protein